ncbi:ABC transporter permease [Verrucomicrobium spinosum]|uniref:ABC transporter permease n=1 Tax=Verrucomicrobium spinosum TaxID=2736 RepID=UPI0001745825|nr:FtsX-like permease family protein [Verrucomicrobium spinosum]
MDGLILLLQRFTFRHWRQAPRTTLLLGLTLALGVAVFLSIRMANRAALSGFSNFTELITAESDFIIQATAGPLPEKALLDLREAIEPFAAVCVPIIETTASPPRKEGEPTGLSQRETFTLYGLDLVSLQNVSTARGQSETVAEGGLGSLSILGKSNAVFISSRLAERRGLKAGDSLELVMQDQRVGLEVAGIMPDRDKSVRVPETFLLMDLPALQRLLGRGGQLDRVEVILEKGKLGQQARAEVQRVLETQGEGRWRVSTPAQRRESASVMTQAFRWNLGILSMLALVVGLYLVFQALDGAVVRRREEIGVLRSLGVEPRTLQHAWLLESLLLGVAGGILGGLLGWVGALAAVKLVGQTVNVLYHTTHTQGVGFTLEDLWMALTLGMGASLVAGWWPARQAARTPPAQLLTRHLPQPVGGGRWRKIWPGLIWVALAAVLATLPPLRLEGGGRFALSGYGAAICLVVGGGLLAGGVLQLMGRFLQPLARWSAPVRLAASHLRRASSRHRLAVAALLCAVAMTSGMAILVGSFDRTMRGWINRTFQADLYVASDGAQSASSQNRILPATWQWLRDQPEVEDLNAICFQPLQLPEGETLLAAGDLGFMQRHSDMAWMQKPESEEIYDKDRNAGLCLVSEAFSERFRKRRGDEVLLPVPDGVRKLRIAGVYSDYGNERGTVIVDRVHYAAWFRDDSASRLAVQLKEGKAPESVRAAWLQRHPGLSIFTNGHLRNEVMRIFKQTFAITYALELIGVVVAVVGLGMSLASVLLERRAELTTLRALGMSREAMARATMLEGVFLALAGTVCGLVVSVALGWVLVFVINKQTFGWTLQFTLPWTAMTVLLLLVVGSAALVSWATGRWGADLPADREE